MTKLVFFGQDYLFDFGENAKYQLHFENEDELTVTVVEDTDNTVTHIDDFVRGISYTNITDLASKSYWRLKGLITK